MEKQQCAIIAGFIMLLSTNSLLVLNAENNEMTVWVKLSVLSICDVMIIGLTLL